MEDKSEVFARNKVINRALGNIWYIKEKYPSYDWDSGDYPQHSRRVKNDYDYNMSILNDLDYDFKDNSAIDRED